MRRIHLRSSGVSWPSTAPSAAAWSSSRPDAANLSSSCRAEQRRENAEWAGQTSSASDHTPGRRRSTSAWSAWPCRRRFSARSTHTLASVTATDTARTTSAPAHLEEGLEHRGDVPRVLTLQRQAKKQTTNPGTTGKRHQASAARGRAAATHRLERLGELGRVHGQQLAEQLRLTARLS